MPTILLRFATACGKPAISAGATGGWSAPSGIGIQIDKRLLRKYGRRTFVTSPFRIALRTIREKGFKAALELKKRKEEE